MRVESIDQNTGVGSLSLPQGIFPNQGLNPGLLHCRQILHQLSHKGLGNHGLMAKSGTLDLYSPRANDSFYILKWLGKNQIKSREFCNL